ncbi:hypothetical protein ACHAWC_006041 [Mediolabrus comicus]
MDRLPKKISLSLVAVAAAVAGGPTTVAAQAQAQRRRGGGRARNFFPHHPQSDDRALRSDANPRAAVDAVPEVASIVNGTSTGGPRKYMVGLHAQSRQNPVNCGGTLIGSTIVLTAAHCISYEGIWNPVDQVLINLYDLNDPAGVITINIKDTSEGGKDIVVHPDYGNTYPADNDIALIFLPVGQVADYAQINDDSHEPVEYDPLRVMGWGWTEYGGSGSDVLLEATVDYISNEDCQEALALAGSLWPITDGNMCAFKKDTGHCNGDSGGPLFLEKEHGDIGNRPTQVGIASWGMPPCVTSGYPAVYTRVSYYAEWIKETVCSRPEHATKELCGSSKSGKRA